MVAVLLHQHNKADSSPAVPCIVKYPERRTHEKIVLVICPHPDDEYEGWAAIGQDETPVFLILTQGEKTSYCKNLSILECKSKRIESLRTFLSSMMTKTYGLFFLDLGDKRLTRTQIEHSLIPLVEKLQPEKLIVAAYYNDGSACTFYNHQDHRVLYDTMKSAKWPVPVFLRIPSCLAVEKKILYVDEMEHSKAWGVRGIGQMTYGWLRQGSWPAGESDTDGISIFTRRQDFMVISPQTPSSNRQ